MKLCPRTGRFPLAVATTLAGWLACAPHVTRAGSDASVAESGLPPCESLADCDGGLGQAICVAQFCASAGQGSIFALGRATLPTSLSSDGEARLQVRVLASELPAGGPLTCQALLLGIDAGTIDPDDQRAANPLLPPYDVPAHLLAGQQLLEFEVYAVPAGRSRLLLLEGQVGPAGPIVGAGCHPYDALAGPDGGPPTVAVSVEPW